MSKEKSGINKGLTKKCYKFLWHDVKVIFISSFQRLYPKDKLSSLQGEAVTHLTEKKNKDGVADI